VGPPGVGKSMLAQRLPGLLPPLDITEALEHAAVASLAGHDWEASAWRQRPWRAPHHSASAVSLVGGGSPPRPGEVSLAHHGVLFLDELPEFPRSALEALREPLETGHISIARAAMSTRFPAQFQLVAAMNPCPCGRLGSASAPERASPSAAWATRLQCRCTPDQVQRYQARLSGPLLDRIDLLVQMNPVAPHELVNTERGESTATVQARCHTARQRAMRRQGGANATLHGEALDAHAALDAAGTQFLRQAAQRLGWSARATHRVLRVARTIADLAGSQAISTAHLAEAVQYRRALPAADTA
jgi:magnesium chelatase family protein